MLDLACSVWKTSVDAAINRLAAVGLLPARANNIELEIAVREVKRRTDYLDLWEQAKTYYPNCISPDIAVIRRKYGLQLSISYDRWKDGPSRLFGALPYPEIRAGWFRDSTDNHNLYQVLKGSRWTEVLMTPFYDMPGRIRAFAFLGRNGDRPGDETFRRTGGVSIHGNDAGLAGVDILPYAVPGPDVIAVDDHMLMLHMQVRTYRVSLIALPMVTWRDDGEYRTSGAWSMLSHKRIIFWTMDLDARVVRQAVECDGFLSIAGPGNMSPAGINHYYRTHPGVDMLRTIKQKARPWPQALGAWLAASSEGEKETLWSALERNGADVSYILRKLGNAAPVGLLSRPGPGKRMIRAGNDRKIITEDGDAWFVQTNKGKSRCEICNAVLRVTHVIKDTGTQELFYRGMIRYKGREIPFVAPMAEIRKNAMAWMDAKMIDSGVGILIVQPRYKHQLHQIAIMFQEPEFVTDSVARWVHRLPPESPAAARRVVSHPVLPGLPAPKN